MDIKTLCKLYQSEKNIKYLFFWGHKTKNSGFVTKSCLSQWYPAQFIVDGVKYTNAEHYMMAGKARLFNDFDALEKIINAKTPGAAKAYGVKYEGLSNLFGRNIGYKLWLKEIWQNFLKTHQWKIFYCRQAIKYW
ncbi:hypothetical protein Xind_01652 [Xenorhabdus indica]|nr:NADAR family protein [Xenorhabdus indica]MBC8945176.1 hypothetical protein [Xenorhabdus indica]